MAGEAKHFQLYVITWPRDHARTKPQPNGGDEAILRFANIARRMRFKRWAKTNNLGGQWEFISMDDTKGQAIIRATDYVRSRLEECRYVASIIPIKDKAGP